MGCTQLAWRPGEGTKTGRVWEKADDLEARFGRLPTAAEVVSAYTAAGGHPGTGQVQYYAWKNARRGGPSAQAAAPVAPPPVSLGGSVWLRVDGDGRVAVPGDLCGAMRLDASVEFWPRLWTASCT